MTDNHQKDQQQPEANQTALNDSAAHKDKGPIADPGRRGFLHTTAIAALPLAYFARGAQLTLAQDSSRAARTQGGMIIRQKSPENLELPFSTLDGFITPNERFYIRSHFPVPKIEAGTWRLRIEGAVERPLELTYEQVLALPSRTQPAMLECAGNSRVFLTPAARGVQWELGAASNAEWTGVTLATILARAGLRPNAVEVVLEGADTGTINDPPRPAGPIHYARSLPLAKAQQEEVLLAYRMNGVPLPPAHGFPLRVVVPGWYAMASIKWLTRILVTDRPFAGYYQTIDYAYWDRSNGHPIRRPITELEVKAAIARPAMNEVVPANSQYRVYGAAWTGESEVTKVELSHDGGNSWVAARLLDKPVKYAWRLWEYDWRTPAQAGQLTLLARATDARGRTQPMQRDADRENYMISHVLPINIEVR